MRKTKEGLILYNSYEEMVNANKPWEVTPQEIWEENTKLKKIVIDVKEYFSRSCDCDICDSCYSCFLWERIQEELGKLSDR